MTKVFQCYFIIWAVLFVLFNVISFVSVGWSGIEKYTSSFWIGYVFITFAFIGQIICAYLALREKNITKTFYKISLVTTSYIGLILSFIFGGLCMIFSLLPYWVSIILCTTVLAFNSVAVVKASVGIDLVNDINDKIKDRTSFIRSLTIDAERLVTHAKSEFIKEECKKVYEVVRYSDPMDNDILNSIESEININFTKFSQAIDENDFEKVSEIAEKLIILFDNRNKNCKLLKGEGERCLHKV